MLSWFFIFLILKTEFIIIIKDICWSLKGTLGLNFTAIQESDSHEITHFLGILGCEWEPERHELWEFNYVSNIYWMLQPKRNFHFNTSHLFSEYTINTILHTLSPINIKHQSLWLLYILLRTSTNIRLPFSFWYIILKVKLVE